MTEAWLLINETALRNAAGNPRGRVSLNMPPLQRLEALADPKAVLHQLLRDASGASGRRLRRFKERDSVQRLGELIEDYTPLRSLPAFQAFESDLVQVLSRLRP
ncbi:MAG TPA: hypothetical protein VNO81_10230 [Candidatus Nitrosotenuis sp.]|jgi:hypothetical protein|nr:hypothetical protein [Candidatus Nitrosotenuis sp.]